MTYTLRLGIDPIPASSRRATLANLLPANQWDHIRRCVYRNARHRCQVCGREGKMYAHEKWQFNEQTGYQSLRGFEALCEKCHKVKHLFFVKEPRQRAILFQHFLTVNKISWDEGIQYLVGINSRRQRLNRQKWIVNFGQWNWQIPATQTIDRRRSYARGNHPTYSQSEAW